MNYIFLLISILSASSAFSVKTIKKHSPFYDEREVNLISNQTVFKKKILRPDYIIIHFTANCSYHESGKAFFDSLRPVSAHYLIGADGQILSMVPESKRAWHAGDSCWKNNTNLGAHSIGIELINPGFSVPGKKPCKINEHIWNEQTGKIISGSPNIWYEFTDPQITSLIKLCQTIIKKYKIPKENILGHSDIAPGRKVDPGPLFPWKVLAENGVGIWQGNLQPQGPWTILEMQKMLQKFGYKISVNGKLNSETTKVVQAFQMHFQQNNISGTPDDETMQILTSLLAEKNNI